MDKKQKEETVRLFSDAFGEVVLPVIENIDGRLTKVEGKLVKVESKLTKVEGKLVKIGSKLGSVEREMAKKNDFDRFERKLNAAFDRADRHGKLLEKHEIKIKKLERKVSASPA